MIVGFIVILIVFFVVPGFCFGFVRHEENKANCVRFTLGPAKLIMQDETGVRFSVDVTEINHPFFDRFFEKHKLSFSWSNKNDEK